jgi:hypothetical protein
MERKERSQHFVRLSGINDKLASMGIEFGITLMEDQDNLPSYSIRAWWSDDSNPSDWTDDSNLFELSQMADAIDWIHSSLSQHLCNRLERIVAEGKEAQKFLYSITDDEFVINGLRL